VLLLALSSDAGTGRAQLGGLCQDALAKLLVVPDLSAVASDDAVAVQSQTVPLKR
jgi:hypothetical protein